MIVSDKLKVEEGKLPTPQPREKAFLPLSVPPKV
jgi:hypothetical protein